MKSRILQLMIIPIAALIFSCSSEKEEELPEINIPKPEAKAEKPANSSGLSEDELKYGIGPVRNVELGKISLIEAKKGEKIFDTKCATCHKLGERYTAPPLGDVLERRTPEYVMNMILNPDEMTKKHPEAKKLLGEYLTQMTFQDVTQEDARAILEFIRNYADKKK